MPNVIEGSAHLTASPELKGKEKRIRNCSSEMQAKLEADSSDERRIILRICSSDSA